MATQEKQVIGGMEILSSLSTGGMGEVLLARKLGAHGFERLVALKTIREDLSSAEPMRKMFLDEAKLLALLAHPTIAQVYDFGEDQGVLFLAMEYVEGIDLGRVRAQTQGALPPIVAARIGLEVCRGLQAAHELTDLQGLPVGAVHRDISPQNLMMTFDGRLKIIDFGVAFMRRREAATTDAGLFKGKLGYVAPEQILGRGSDARSDLYGLSVVLYELLTGSPLFAKGRALADALTRGPVDSTRVKNPKIPKELDALVMRGLAHDPADRFESAKAMARALEAVIDACGGETLESFAERALKRSKEQHRSWLQAVLRGEWAGGSTEDLFASPLDEAPVEYVSETWLERHQSSPPEPSPAPSERPARRRKKPRRWAAAFVVLSAVGLGWWFSGEAPKNSAAQLRAAIGAKGRASDAGASSTEAPEEVKAPSRFVGVRATKPDKPAKADAGTEPPKKTRTRVSQPPARKTKRTRSTKKGTLSVLARPGGAISVDGRWVGKTPLKRYWMKPGRYQVGLMRAGDRRPRWTSWVKIKAGKHVRIRLR